MTLFLLKLPLIKTPAGKENSGTTTKFVRNNMWVHGNISWNTLTLLQTWQKEETKSLKVTLKLWWLLMFWLSSSKINNFIKLKFLSSDFSIIYMPKVRGFTQFKEKKESSILLSLKQNKLRWCPLHQRSNLGIHQLTEFFESCLTN